MFAELFGYDEKLPKISNAVKSTDLPTLAHLTCNITRHQSHSSIFWLPISEPLVSYTFQVVKCGLIPTLQSGKTNCGMFDL